MRWVLAFILSLFWACSGLAQTAKTPAQLQAEISSTFRSGCTACITPSAVSAVLGDMVASTTSAANITNFGAKCDGVTDDSSAFTSALSTSNSITIPVGLTCIIHDITISANQILDCNGSVLQAPTIAGANQWVVKKTGFNSRIRNCQVNDPSNATKHSTTLNGAVSPGATTIVVASAVGMQVNQAIAIALDSGAYWPTKITNIAGTTITLADVVPSTQAVTPTISAGGSSYAVNDHLIVQGGIGPPITAHVLTLSGSAVATAALDAPGLYSIFPSSPAAVLDSNSQLAAGATLIITAAGASSGNVVESTWGTLVIDNGLEGFVENVTFGTVPAGLQILNSNGMGTAEETVRTITVNSFQLFAIFKDVNVHDSRFIDIIGFGSATHNASTFGVVGVYINGDNPGSTPTGGNLFRGITMLTAENAWLDNNGQLDTFNQIVGDTTRNYNFICNTCVQNMWGGTTNMLFSGPNVRTGGANAGGGMYFGGAAINNVLEGLRTNNNAFDVHIADSTSAVWISGQAWGPFKVASGNTGSLRAGTIFSAASAAGVGGSGSTNYLGPGGFNSALNASAAVIPYNTTFTQFSCASTGAPGAGQSYTCNLVDGTNVLGSCSYSGAAAFGCTYTGPGIFTFPNHQIAIQIVASASAAASQFRGYTVGF